MKYNKAFTEGEFFENYTAYLETVIDKFPKELFEFVSNSVRHNLEEKSLHDSWVDEIGVTEKRERKESGDWQKRVQISIILLGPYHDRTFELKFNNVCFYKLEMKSESHTDLITYEIYPEILDGKDILVFNAEFADDSVFLIKAEHIEITESLLENQS